MVPHRRQLYPILLQRCTRRRLALITGRFEA